MPNLNNLSNLWYLELGFNKLSSIPMAIRTIHSLDTLNLIKNPISHLPQNMFLNQPRIRELKLDFFLKLEMIDDCVFCGLIAWVELF